LYVAEADVLVVILDALWKVILFGESDRIMVGGLQWQCERDDDMEGGMEGAGGGGAPRDTEGELGFHGTAATGDGTGAEEPENLYLRLFNENGGFDGLYRLEDRKDRVVAEAAQQMLALVRGFLYRIFPLLNAPSYHDPYLSSRVRSV
jgi:hypothetical protein